jgi:hypothetical protein
VRQRLLVRLLARALIVLAAPLGAQQAAALGWARAHPAATLGYPLDFQVALRLDPDETITHECVAAEVMVGDVVLPREAVGASLDLSQDTPTIRVRTRKAIEEPVVIVSVTAGCRSTVTRQFTLFADPPGLAMTPPAAAVAPAPAPDGDAAAQAGSQFAAAPHPTPVSDRVAASLPAAASFNAETPRPVAKKRPRMAVRSPSATAPLQVAAAQPRRPEAGAPSRPARPARPASVAAKTAVRAPERARLRLDRAELFDQIAAAAAAASAAAAQEQVARAAEQAASAAHAAASAAAARVSTLERELQTLRQEAQANREATARLSRALADADERGRWTPWLVALMAGLAMTAAWLWVRLREAQREAQAAWWEVQRAGEDAAAAAAAPAPEPAPQPLPRAPALAPLPEPATSRLPSPMLSPLRAADDEPAAVVASEATDDDGAHRPAREISIDELLDLEQQAEFFVVLGQDDAAADLLVGHLRSTGGAVPMPYLKLMEIHRRSGDEAAYERIRERFHQRFNALAPAWGEPVHADRTLDDYPEVLAQIERAWANPVDAMALLETLLFRSDGRELFDLAAYREVMFLYTLARDVHEAANPKAERVDVLLPLGNDSAFATTLARPYLTVVSGSRADAAGANDDAPTAPLSLDVLEPQRSRAPSQFGFFDDTKPGKLA